MATPGEFATGGAVLRVWTTATSEVVYERPFEESIIGAVFDPSGRYVAVGTRDGAAVVVDVQAGTELLRVRHDELSSIGFSPTGRFLTTTGNDGTARAWFWQRTDIVADACARVTRNLTWAEWRDYLPADEPYNKTCSSLPVHPSVLEAARTLARKGDTAAATAIFERAVELEPALGFVPADEAKRWTTAAGGGGKR